MKDTLAHRQRLSLQSFMKRRGLNVNSWSEKANMSPNTLYSFINGRTQTITFRTLECLASAANSTVPEILGDTKASSDDNALPVIGLASCGIKGWNNSKETTLSTERPSGLNDPHAFAVIAHGDSMRPDGIMPGHICLCSPAATAESGDAVYIERDDGHCAIKTFRGVRDGWLIVTGYMPPDKTGHQEPYTEEISSKHVVRLAPVIYVKRK